MRLENKELFLDKSRDVLEGMYDAAAGLPSLKMVDLDQGSTALIVVDMINGFAREGALQSPYIEALIPGTENLMKVCGLLKIPVIAFADCHTDASPEFDSYPPHCKAGTSESEILDELKSAADYLLIPKNSTNGYLEEPFQKWLSDNSKVNCFIIAGDCTDICVLQLAVTLKTWFNRMDRRSRIIVPVNAVDTFDLGLHNRELLNLVSLHIMMGNGIEVVKEIV